MIQTDIDNDGIASLSLNRLEAKNAMSTAMWQALSAAIESLGTAPRVLQIRSCAGRMFCPGADIKEFPLLMKSAEARATMRGAMQGAVDRLERTPYPTLAVINGHCVGAGVSIAMACDVRIAVNTARFGVTPAKLGLVYSKDDIRRLATGIGPANAKDLLFTGRLIDASEAKAMSMIQQSVEADALTSVAADLSKEIASKSAQTHRTVKQSFRVLSGLEAFDEQGHAADFENAFVSDDAPQRIEAMLNQLTKRP